MCYKDHVHLPAITSGVKIMDAPFSFNRSIRIGSRRDRITGDSGALTGRELLRRSRVVRFLAKRLPDKRDGRRIRHSQKRLARTLLLLAGQGRREHSDATELRDDPALRLATGDRAGTAPLGKAGRLPSPSIAVVSRRVASVVGEGGAARLARDAFAAAAFRWRRRRWAAGRRPKTLAHRHRQPAGRGPGNSRAARGTATIIRRVYSSEFPWSSGGVETGEGSWTLRLREGQVRYERTKNRRFGPKGVVRAWPSLSERAWRRHPVREGRRALRRRDIPWRRPLYGGARRVASPRATH